MKRSNVKVMPRAKAMRSAGPQAIELELYRRIFRSANDAIAIIDANGFYLEQNAAHEQLTGYSDAELEGKTPAIHFGEETFKRIAEELEHKGTYCGALTSRNKQGLEQVIELSAFSMHDADGRVLCHVGMKREVTDRKRASAELQARVRQQAVVARLGQQALAGQELEALMQDAVSSAAEVLSSEYGKLLELLPGGQHFLLRAGAGWEDGLVGNTLVSTDPDSHAGYTLHCSAPVVVEDLATETRFHGAPLLRDHKIVSGLSVLVPVHGRAWGVLTVHTTQRRKFSAHDVNFLVSVGNVLAAAIERRQSEEALRQSETRFRRAQRSASLGAYEWDLRTNQIFWSEPVPSLAYLTADGNFDFWFNHVHREDRERVRQVLERAIRAGSEFEIQMRMVNHDEVVWVVFRGQVFNERGQPVQVAGIIMDITARKQTEELLQRSEKLAMIGRLAASIAHEINNPLESVTNLLYLIEHQPDLDATTREYARLASEELGRVAHISRQTLGFYRDSSQPTAVDLAELLDDVIRLYARKLERKHITIHRDYRVHDRVALYPNEIRQVFSNLLMNALEASTPGCTITVRLENGGAWGRPELRGVRLLLADQGHGIDRRNCRRVFEPFFTTKGEKGTGLGLWVCNGLVQKHGGSLRLRTSTDSNRHGTVFAVFLPIAEAVAASAGAVQGESAEQQ